MANRERQSGPSSGRSEPLHPSPLPPELADFLKRQRLACLIHGSDRGTVLVIKAPDREIDSVRGTVPVELHQELHQRPTAPVIRMVMRIYDQPVAPLALETFINVEDPQQRSDYEALSDQKELDLLFYDEALSHRLTKRVPVFAAGSVRLLLSEADRIHASIPKERYDFNLAKAEVLDATDL